MAQAADKKKAEEVNTLIDIGIILDKYGTNIYKHDRLKLIVAREDDEYFVFRLGKTKEQTTKLFHAGFKDRNIQVHTHQKGRWKQQITELAEKCRGGEDNGQEKETNSGDDRGTTQTDN